MDRQDIDALLIGALYGELTPADEARLTAHLDSHPADKTALDDLKAARATVKASRIFEMQTDPPQAISAVLLQEAARRSPRRAVAVDGERESWFHRFVRSFAAHPAMAAAAMLVVVVGVAGTLYMKNGDQFAEKTAATEQVAVDTTRADGVAAGPAVAGDAGASAIGKDEVATGAAAAGSAAAYDVALAERPQVAPSKTAETAKADRARVADDDSKKPAVAHAAGKKGYIEVTTPQQMPKEMPAANADKEEKFADGDFAKAPASKPPTGTTNGLAFGGEAGATRGASAGAGGAPPGGAPATASIAAAPPPPPADQRTAPAKPTAPSPKAVAKAPAPAMAPQQDAPVEAQPSTDTSLIAWAKQQHKNAVEAVRAKNCAGAAQIAVAVRNRAYGYFTQNMQNDRDLKGCASYIADAVNRDEERASKPKAAKRAVDESPAPTSVK